jgi:hypothetical protein
MGEEGKITESKWKKQLVSGRYKKEFDSEFECFHLEITDPEKLKGIVSLLEKRFGENTFDEMQEGREKIRTFFSIVPTRASPYGISLTFKEFLPAKWKELRGPNNDIQRNFFPEFFASKKEFEEAINKKGSVKEIATIDKQK